MFFSGFEFSGWWGYGFRVPEGAHNWDWPHCPFWEDEENTP